jgi:uncharacterized iron-regulated membrane protein
MHLWVGLSSGLILFVVCLSGTTYVFNKEITKWVESDKFYVDIAAGTSALPAEELIAKVEKEKKGLKVSAITVPAGKNEAWLFSMTDKKKKEEKGAVKNEKEKTAGKNGTGKPKREKLQNFLVNPYTGHIQGNAQTTTSQFFNTVLELHRWLLMDHEVGSIVTAVAAFLFLFLEISGLALWLPAKLKSWKRWNAWKPGFTIKRAANWKRVNHDMHKALGFYTFIIITIMALTGPVFGLEWYRKAFHSSLGAKLPVKGEEGPKSKQPADSLVKPLKASQWIAVANSVYQYEGDLRIALPKGNTGSVSISKTRAGFMASAGVDKLFLDQYSNNIIRNEKFADKNLGQQISSMAKAIHTGEVFGVFSKIIYFIACLIATSLPVTGTIIWINKSRKSRKKARREVSQRPQLQVV